MNRNSESPIELVGGNGERIYIRLGTIFAFKNDPKKKYEIVTHTFHVDQKQFERMVFFNTPEEAKAAGYKYSFLRRFAQRMKDRIRNYVP